jgi:hypothetical protein
MRLQFPTCASKSCGVESCGRRRLFASVTAENGAQHRNHTLNKFEMTVFPQGAIHTEFNRDCVPAIFVAAFPDEDVSILSEAQ